MAHKTDPFGLIEFQSWLLFVLGVVFSIVALIDGLIMRDKYPGYTPIVADWLLRATTIAWSAKLLFKIWQTLDGSMKKGFRRPAATLASKERSTTPSSRIGHE